MVKILKKVDEDANVLVITDDSIPTPEPTSWQASQLENVFVYNETTRDIYVSDKLKIFTLDDSVWVPVSRAFSIQASPKDYWFIVVNNSSVSLEIYTWVNLQAMLAWWKMAYVSVFNNWSNISISIYWSAWDTNDLWFFVNESSLTTSHPTANNWNYAIVWTTDSIWIWDWDTNTWKDSKVTPTVNEAPIDWKLYVRKNWSWVDETNNINDIYNHIQVDANLDLSVTWYVNKSIYHIQPAWWTITITIPDVASSTDWSRAIFTIHEPWTVIIKTLSWELIENSPEQILTTWAFTLISLWSHYIITQDSRPKIQNTSLTFYTLNEDSTESNWAWWFYKQSSNSITDSRYNQSTATELSSAAITWDNILWYWAISDSSTVTWIIPEWPIATTLSIRKISWNANFNYHVSFYKRTAWWVETLLCTTTNSATITSNTHSQVTVTWTFPQTSFISTDTLVRKILLNKVWAWTDPVAWVNVEWTSPSYSVVSIWAWSISHNILAWIQLADTWVTNGHISDTNQSIYWVKRFMSTISQQVDDNTTTLAWWFISQLITDTQTQAQTLHNIALWSSAVWHTWINLSMSNASTLATWINITTWTTFTWSWIKISWAWNWWYSWISFWYVAASWAWSWYWIYQPILNIWTWTQWKWYWIYQWNINVGSLLAFDNYWIYQDKIHSSTWWSWRWYWIYQNNISLDSTAQAWYWIYQNLIKTWTSTWLAYWIYQSNINNSSWSWTWYWIYQNIIWSSSNSSSTSTWIQQIKINSWAWTAYWWRVSNLEDSATTWQSGFFQLANNVSSIAVWKTTHTWEIASNRTSTITTWSYTDNFSMLLISRTSTQNWAWWTFISTWAVLSLSNSSIQTAWTLTDTVAILKLTQSNSISNGWHISFNAYTPWVEANVPNNTLRYDWTNIKYKNNAWVVKTITVT